MFFPSGYYRAKARAALKGHWEIALLIALIVNLPSLLVQGIAVFTGNDLVDRLQAIVVTASREGNYSQQLLVQEVRSFLQSTGFLTTQGLNIAAWLVTPCLALGMYKGLLDLLRGQAGPVATAVCRVKLFFKAIGLQLLIILKVLAWMLPGLAAAGLSLVPLFQAGNDQEKLLSALQTSNAMTLPVLLLMIVPGVIAALRYAMSEYILADEPDTRIRECVRTSKKLMQDQKKSLFFLMVSFLLWYLAQMLVASMLSGLGSDIFSLMFQMLSGLALNVYMCGSVADFFLQLRGEETRVPDPADVRENEDGPEDGAEG